MKQYEVLFKLGAAHRYKCAAHYLSCYAQLFTSQVP